MDTWFVQYQGQAEFEQLKEFLFSNGYAAMAGWDEMNCGPGIAPLMIIRPVEKAFSHFSWITGAAVIASHMRFFSVKELLAFGKHDFQTDPRHLLFHVPHAGDDMPKELLESSCIPRAEFMRYHETMRDTEVWQLIPKPYRKAQTQVIFPVSRLLCDVERFIGTEEIMERYGMGFCYEKAYDGRRIKTVGEPLREKTRQYYDEHHRKLDEIAMKAKRLLVIDLHSYSAEITPKDFLKEQRLTPDVCIGADDRFTPAELVKLAAAELTGQGLSVAVNYPYCGTLVPNAAIDGRGTPDAVSIKLEFKKGTYLDDNGNVREDQAEKIRQAVENLIASIAERGI